MPYIIFNLVLSVILLTSNNVRGWGLRAIIWLWTAYTLLIAWGIFSRPVTQFFHNFTQAAKWTT